MRTDGVGLFNAVGRRARARDQARYLDRVGRREGVLFWVVVEAPPHFEAPKGWEAVQVHEWADSHTVMILARKGLPNIRLVNHWARRMTLRWWGFRIRRWRAPRTIPTAVFAERRGRGPLRWVRGTKRWVLGVHYPVGNPGSRREMAEYLLRFALNPKRPRVVAGGDWNSLTRHDNEGFGPAWLAEQAGWNQISADTIDHLMGDFEPVRSKQLDRPGALTDHDPVVFWIKW